MDTSCLPCNRKVCEYPWWITPKQPKPPEPEPEIPPPPFKCFKCRNPITDEPIMVHDNRKYCDDHYYHEFSPPCLICKKLIRDAAIILLKDNVKQHFHVKCFVCSVCNEPIQTEYRTDEAENRICFRCYPEIRQRNTRKHKTLI